MKAPIPFEDHFIPEPNSGCWLLIDGHITEKGYGKITYKGKVTRAHRASYDYYKGPIPLGMCVLHKCDNPLCGNPDHLSLGSHSQNMQDMKDKNRSAKSKRRLNPESVLEIFKDNRTHTQIAKTHGVHVTTVEKIKAGVLWYKVTGKVKGSGNTLEKFF